MESKLKTNILIILTVVIIVLSLALFSVIYKSANQSKQNIECTVPSDLRVTYDRPVTQDERLNGTYWACNGLVCTRLLTPQEWVNKNCFIQENQNVCNVRTPQGDFVYPLDIINVSAIRECAQYLCVQEVLVRNASYIIPAT